MKAELPDNEEVRLQVLHEFQILDTLPQQAYDDISHLAAQICGTPIALVSLVDHNRQWFKSKVGIEAQELPRDLAFCAHAILQPAELFVVTDARQDARFSDNPLVTGAPHIRFYAGSPLIAPDGEAMGTLCVVDYKPRQLSEKQREALQALSRQVMAQMQLQKYFTEISQTLHERRKIEKELRESEQRFLAFMNNSPALAFIKDAAGFYTYVNQPFLRRFQLQEADVLGKRDADLWPAAATKLRQHDQKVLKGDKTLTMTEMVSGENGEISYWTSFKFPLQNKGERFLGGIGLDITQSKKYEQELERYQKQLQEVVAQLEIQSRSDSLTGLLNRRAFQEKLDEEFARARRYEQPLSLLMLDVDQFKSFNDEFGHRAGDEALKTVAHTLQNKARHTDFVTRYGGEEFIIILPNTPLKGAQAFAERFRQTVQEVDWPKRKVTVSIGVSSLTPDITQSDALVEAADQALYRAKANGRNRVEAMS